MKTIKITTAAIEYLKNSLIKENNNNINLYLSVIYQSTQHAHVNMIYCTIDDINEKDIKLPIENINIYIDYKSIKFLEDSLIDINNENLSINAPNIIHNENIKLSIEEKIRYLFENEVNTVLSQHSGFIELVNVENNEIINIKFHGGCQGCGMANYTLNNYIEKIIKKKFPQIKKINDISSHDIKSNSYY
ncbi:MAG TPA: NifU family protein [Candidatus Azoamicus sp. OHIO1]